MPRSAKGPECGAFFWMLHSHDVRGQSCSYHAAARPLHECQCAGRGFLPRNSNHYDLVKTEGVSVQTNSALFVAADKDCEDLGAQADCSKSDRSLINQGVCVQEILAVARSAVVLCSYKQRLV
jgi:hypothetical protein